MQPPLSNVVFTERNVEMERMYTIATAHSRRQKVWVSEEVSWQALTARMGKPIVTGETMEEYRAMSRSDQADVKDVGGFVGGTLRDGRRSKGSVVSRSLITLDMDHGYSGIVEKLKEQLPFTCFLYSTHKSTADRPRLRLVIPLLRDVTAAEYGAVSRKVASHVGMDLFDDTTYEPERLMYWGSISRDGVYVAEEIKGDILDPDMILAEYEDWTDMSSWPVSNGQCFSGKEEAAKAQDPYRKLGFVGAFCRAYPMEEAIGTFMADVYAPSAHPGRFDYIPADSSAGVVVYEGKFMYSYHATDPLCGRLLNAFDAVRLHKFGHMDQEITDDRCMGKRPSYKAMIALVQDDERVRQELLHGKEVEAKADFAASEPAQKGDGPGTKTNHDSSSHSTKKGELSKRLKFKSDGTVDSCLTNFLAILELDERLSSICYNLLKDSVDVRGNLPWKRVKPGWSDTDMSQLNAYLSRQYDIYGPLKSKDALISVASERQFHPIREYFAALPAWDGVKRVETLLVDYLGAEDNAYTWAVTRKTLAAAVARIHRPGIKFDSVLILNGPQGIGKSMLFEKLGKEWFSDSLTLTDMRDKTAAEKLQGYFLLEMGELAGMKKADIETVKSFLSRTDDKYRASYGVNVESHPRQCVIVGTTNAENGFLRDVTGNRRFWPVTVTGISDRKPWHMKDKEIDQIWAEAIFLYKNHEPLHLETDLMGAAVEMQRKAMETDEREGLVQKYLDTPVPLDWNSMDLTARRLYLAGDDLTSGRKGTLLRKMITNMEIYAECFGLDPAHMKKQDSYDITSIMSKMPKWCKSQKKKGTIYGRQRCYIRNME